MSFYTYDTKDFTEEDFAVFQNLYGFSVRQSVARGERNRGRLISVDKLLIPDEDTVKEKLPAGFVILPSAFVESDGTIAKRPVPQTLEKGEEAKIAAIRMRLQQGEEQAALNLLADMTTTGVITKRDTVITSIKAILMEARKSQYAKLCVLDIYKQIPQLKARYFDNEKKRAQMQSQLDKLITGQMSKAQLTNPFDKLYLLGLLDMLGWNRHVQ